jgi:hypothetical protein
MALRKEFHNCIAHPRKGAMGAPLKREFRVRVLGNPFGAGTRKPPYQSRKNHE